MPFFVASVSNFLAHYDMMQKEPEFAASIRQLQSDKAQLYFLKKKKGNGTFNLRSCFRNFIFAHMNVKDIHLPLQKE